MTIDILNTVSLPVTKVYLRRFAGGVLRRLGVRSCAVCIWFCDNRTIRRYNRRYLRKNRPTDVIAFYEKGRLPGDRLRYLGDVMISVEQARKQAKALNCPVKKELSVLVTHGILHLLGWKDVSLAERKRMFKKQEKLYTAFKG